MHQCDSQESGKVMCEISYKQFKELSKESNTETFIAYLQIPETAGRVRTDACVTQLALKDTLS